MATRLKYSLKNKHFSVSVYLCLQADYSEIFTEFAEWFPKMPFCVDKWYKVFSHHPQNLPTLRWVIEEEFDNTHLLPDFCRRVCYTIHNRCKACVADGGVQFET